MADQTFPLLKVRRSVGEEGSFRTDLQNSKVVGDHGGMDILRGQKLDYGRSVVLDARPADFMEVWVKQLLQARSIAAHPRMMEFDFKFAEVAEQIRHFVGEMCGLTQR